MSKEGDAQRERKKEGERSMPLPYIYIYISMYTYFLVRNLTRLGYRLIARACVCRCVCVCACMCVCVSTHQRNKQHKPRISRLDSEQCTQCSIQSTNHLTHCRQTVSRKCSWKTKEISFLIQRNSRPSTDRELITTILTPSDAFSGS